jgi:hypothetical protein
MRIFLSGPSMCGPSSVTNPVSTIEWIQPDGFFEISQFAFCSPNLQLVVFVNYGYARRIVSAILQLA